MSKTSHNTGENPMPTDPDSRTADSTQTATGTPTDPSNDGGTEATGAAEQVETDPVARLEAERDQLHNQLQRTLADLQNFRKRRMQEMSDARRGAKEALIGELLPILDNFHLAIDYDASVGDTAASSMREGLLMVRSLFEDVFERHGVVEIPAAGALFDPAVHEAVGIDPDPIAEAGIVSRVVQRGYTIDGKVLRPTRVMVGGGSQIAPHHENEQED